MKKPELLSPVGDFESLRAAIDAGADAVYFGLKELSMRAGAKNFELKDLKKIVKTCGKVKSYLTINTIIYDNEIKNVEKIIKKAKEVEVNAIICWDFSVIKLCQKYKIPFFVSTQASIANVEAAKSYKKLGAKRVVLARELNLDQIKKIAKEIEVEVFIHGAMCYSISGRCFFSQEMYGRSANRGECIQPCRREYKLTDLETGKEVKVKNKFFLSPKDLCALPFIDKMIKAGIQSFKIEGRQKGAEYVHTVTKIYREAIDAYFSGKFNKKLSNKLVKELEEVYNRKLHSGFLLGSPTADDITNLYGSAAKKKKIQIGKVENYYVKPKVAVIKLQSGKLDIGDEIIIIGPTTGVMTLKIESMERHNKPVDKVKKGEEVGIKVKKRVRPSDKVFIWKTL